MNLSLIITIAIFLLGHLLAAVIFATRLQVNVEALTNRITAEVAGVRVDLSMVAKEVTGTRSDFNIVRLNSERIDRLRTDVMKITVELKDLPVIRTKIEACERRIKP